MAEKCCGSVKNLVQFCVCVSFVITVLSRFVRVGERKIEVGGPGLLETG